MVKNQPDHDEHSSDHEPSRPSAEQHAQHSGAHIDTSKCQHYPSSRLSRWIAPEWVNALSTVTIAIFTGVLTWTSIGQLATMDGQLNQMIVAERAWIGFTEGSYGKLGSAGPIVLKYVNAGKSPATIKSLMIQGVVTNVPSPEPTNLEIASSRGVLVPGGTGNLFLYRSGVSSKDEIAAIYSGVLHYYLFAKVIYTTVDGVDRFTRACFVYDPLSEKYLGCAFYSDAT